MTSNIFARNTQIILGNYIQLENLPNEVHEKIFSYLDIESLLNLSCTNRFLENMLGKKFIYDIHIYVSNIITQLQQKNVKIKKNRFQSLLKMFL